MCVRGGAVPAHRHHSGARRTAMCAVRGRPGPSAAGAGGDAMTWALLAVTWIVAAVGKRRSRSAAAVQRPARNLQVQRDGAGECAAARPAADFHGAAAPLGSLWPWLVGGLVALAVGRLSLFRTGLLWRATSQAFGFLIVAAMFSGPLSYTAKADSVRRGRLALIDDLNPPRRGSTTRRFDPSIPRSGWRLPSLIYERDRPFRPKCLGRVTSALTLPAHNTKRESGLGAAASGGCPAIALSRAQPVPRASRGTLSESRSASIRHAASCAEFLGAVDGAVRRPPLS